MFGLYLCKFTSSALGGESRCSIQVREHGIEGSAYMFGIKGKKGNQIKEIPNVYASQK